MFFSWLFVIGSVLQVVTGAIVPPLFDYDNLTQCRQDHSSEAVFCYVKVITKVDDPFRSPDDASSSRVTQQFRRNLLDYAICVPDCEREVAQLSDEDRDRLYCEEFPVTFRHLYSTWHWETQLEPYEKKYSKLINICVNNCLERRYNLTYHGYSKIEYCLGNESQSEKEIFDVLMLLFLAIVAMLLVTLIYANLCDALGIRRNLIISSFAIRQSWRNFTEQSKSDLYADFAYIDGLRVVINFIILYGHCVIVPTNMPVDNPEDLEQYSTEVLTRYLTTMFAFPVQIFFTISGLLLVVNFLRDIRRKPNLESRYFRSKIVNRLIRILPVYYFFLLMASVGAIMPGLKLGLLGYTVLVREQQVCRSNWWTNLLMINNLPFYEDQCFCHGWYLGADLQLFLFGLLVLWIIWKMPRVAKLLFWGLAAISVTIPAIIQYRTGIESIMATRHSQTPFLFMYDSWVREIYQPSYNNINSFFGGMIAGYLYHKIKHDKLNLNDSWCYNILLKIATPLFILSILPINLFFTHNVPKWGILLHSLLHRNTVVIMVCLGYIKCFHVPKGCIRRILSSRILTTMGKLCYSSYVLHTLLIRYIVNRSTELLHFSAGDVTTLTLATVGLSYVASVPVYLGIEQPVSAVLKGWFAGESKKKAT